MAEFVAMPLWTDAYLGDTTHLSTLEHGAYMLLLISAWRSKNGKLPNDDKILAKYARLSTAQWKRVKPILEPFFKVSPSHWVQGRLIDEREAVRQKSKRQSDKAKTRWLKTKKTAKPRHPPGNAEAMPPLPVTHNPVLEDKERRAREFEKFWNEFPKGRPIGNKAEAEKKFQKLLTDGVNPDAITTAATAYRKFCDSGNYNQHAITWLNQRGWETNWIEQLGSATGKAGKARNGTAKAGIDEQVAAINARILGGENITQTDEGGPEGAGESGGNSQLLLEVAAPVREEVR
jgi:uncharacterized protein YdaU (DUF1376 family)